MEIRSQSKLFDVLQSYPFLEEVIIGIAPPFKNLKNPVLCRTVGQLATIGKVAQIGNVDVTELVNSLRRAAGQPELGTETEAVVVIPGKAAGDPDWIQGEPQFIVDGTEMLKQGEVPLVRVNELLGQLTADGYILLVTDFEPLPIMENMQKRDKRFFHKLHPENAGTHLTYIQ